MSKPSIVCVVPSIRESQMESFRAAWAPLFEKHSVTLITVWDGNNPVVEVEDNGENTLPSQFYRDQWEFHGDIVCRKTDAVRNLGFIHAAKSPYDYILTLDDDVAPPAGSDPIQEHLDVLQRRVPISWMNTCLDTVDGKGVEVGAHMKAGSEGTLYLRGFPYGIRDEAPVMVSHGVWINVPDFDGKTQLKLTENGTRPQDLPYSLPYFRGPVPKGCYMPICGMSLMVRKEALPYLYFAPMGPDLGVPDLHRFSDIWMGLLLKRQCDSTGWAIYTGASTVIHTRASDPFKNVEQEKLGMEWNEEIWKRTHPIDGMDHTNPQLAAYWRSYLDKAARFRDLIRELQGKS